MFGFLEGANIPDSIVTIDIDMLAVSIALCPVQGAMELDIMRSILAATAFLLSGLLGASFTTPAMAATPSDYTFIFKGTCDSCGLPLVDGEYGPGNAYGTLTLTNYVLGALLTADNVSWFKFASDNFGSVTSSSILGIEGKLTIPQAGDDMINLSFMANEKSYSFRTWAEGTGWSIEQDSGLYSEGNSHRWSAAPVPEPETYAMMLAGLGLVGAVARRRKATQR